MIRFTVGCSLVIIGWMITALGILEILVNMEENQCEMTYMFEWPEYIPINLDPVIKKKFPRYSLVLYGEGQYAANLQEFGPSGIPVLFIPGNAGSHKQVRSLGSVALRKTKHLGYHFNYFAVDFEEELSALRGSYLKSQTEFVHECLKLILSLYRDADHSRQSVVLIGHSMGGVIARGLFTLKSFDPTSVTTIITLATPNLKPPLAVDHEMQRYYIKLNEFWKEDLTNASSEKTLMHVVVVSIGGGNRDIQVQSDLTSLGSAFLGNQSVSVIMNAIPKVWVSADHRCIVWCKQLVLAITRALMDMVNKNELAIEMDSKLRLEALKYHLISAFSTKKSFFEAEAATHLPKNKLDLTSCKILENSEFFNSVSQPKYSCFLMRIEQKSGELAAYYDGDSETWIGICESTIQCTSYLNLAKKAEIISTRHSQAKVFTMEISEMSAKGRVILFTLSDQRNDILRVMINKKDDIMEAPLGILPVKKELMNRKTFSRIKLPFLNAPWLAYSLNVKASSRKTEPSISICFRVPWMKEEVYKVFSSAIDMPLKFNSAPSLSVSRLAFHKEPEILFWFNSKCNFTLKISFDLMGTAGQLLRFSYPSILPWIAALSILWFAVEKCSFSNKGNIACIISFSILVPLFVASVYAVSPVVLITSQIIISNGITVVIRCLSRLMMCTFSGIGMSISWVLSIFKSGKNCSLRYLSIGFLIIDTVFPAAISLFISGAVGILAYIIICCIRTVLIGAVDVRCFHCSIVMLLLNSANLVTWIKELEYQLRIDSELSNVTCAAFILIMCAMNYCEERIPHEINCYVAIASSFAMLIVYQSNAVCWIPEIFSSAMFMHVIFTKNRILQGEG